jgi:hypothetical protein
MAKIAIITRSQNSSPRVLAESLNILIKKLGSESTIFFKINVIKRLLKYKDVKHNVIIWFIYKSIFAFSDHFYLKKLKRFDAIIISDCCPLAFLKNEYNIEKLRSLLGNIPILFYEVYYLGNAPTQLSMLQKHNHYTIDRYNWHLSISNVTEIRSKPSYPWSQVGIYLKGLGLAPVSKRQIFAIVDFAQPGFEHFRNEQIKVLQELNISFISLEKRYKIEQIRQIYKNGTFYFMQSTEAFGLPIAECLCYGNYVFTPDSSWPMSWRLDDNPQIHGQGALPECFVVYRDEKQLKIKLEALKENYNFEKTPKEVFDIFFKFYPSFYEGNPEALKEVLEKIELNQLNNR